MTRIGMGIREAGAIAVFALVLWTAFLVARRLTGRRGLATWPFAFALMVAWESVLLNALSLVRWVTPIGILAGNLATVGVVTAWFGNPSLRWRAEYAAAAAALRTARAALMVVPLAVLLALTAYFYPPNTFDSMTYHMARVAHWVQNQSVGFYPTSTDRQNWMAPGAEYLILVLQVMAGTDQWANIVQFIAWLMAICSMPSLCRLAGVPRALCPWAAVCVAGLPMGIMQATSTQTDMVAATMALAIFAALLPLFRRFGRWRVRDVVCLSIALSAGLMVKQTAPLAAAPFLAAAVWTLIRSRREWHNRSGFLRASGLAALAIGVLVCGPHMIRLRVHADKAPYVSSANVGKSAYGIREWHGARLFNPVLATYAQHNFGRAKVPQWCSWLAERMGLKIESARLRRHQVLKMNEDFVGNPLQLWAGLFLLAWLLWAWRRLTARRRCLALAPFACWMIFHWFIRDAVWVSRVQLPLFFLLPLAWTALSDGIPGVRAARSIMIGMSVFGLAYGFYAATHNETKELYPGELFHVDRDRGYYARNWVKPRDDQTLSTLRGVGGTHLGLYFGLSDYEYPLTWRAMREGFQVRHCSGTETWPDVILSLKGRPPAAPGCEPWVLQGTDNTTYEIYVKGGGTSRESLGREAQP